MKKTSLSALKCGVYIFLNVLHIVFFVSLMIVLLDVEYNNSKNIALIMFFVMIFSVLAFYPLVFLVRFYIYDKNTLILFADDTDDIVYKRNGKEHLTFNVRDINKINVCFPFIRITVNHYYKLYLKSGHIIIISCLVPIKELKKRVTNKNEKIETVFWISDFTYNDKTIFN